VQHDVPLAISTLRGQFADNGQWCADPARPAVVVGTVDMIGSRLLFNGYGCGFKTKPLHAGLLGQDTLIVHDEAHLEPAFQDLLVAIESEQVSGRTPDYRPCRVMALSATARGADDSTSFGLTSEEQSPPDVIPAPPTEPIHHVWRRLKAKKEIRFSENTDEKNLGGEIADLALKHESSGCAVLVFVRKVEDVGKVVNKLPKGRVQQLTGTLRGLERDRLIEDAIFRRFLTRVESDETVYLVCTSAGEVGVNISADHLVCDLSTFDSMAQRFGRVNRFGDCLDTRIDIVYPASFASKGEISDFNQKRQKTLKLLEQLDGDGSPMALGTLDLDSRLDAFSPPPQILPVSDILFDAWTLTTIRDDLPGRPPVEPYLHGIREWEPPETRVAWRDEVGTITGELLEDYKPKDLLNDYPLKPHELLRDRTDRVFGHLKKLNGTRADEPVWLVQTGGSVEVTTLNDVVGDGKKRASERIYGLTVLLPPAVGGLSQGMLDGSAAASSDGLEDVADQWLDEKDKPRRCRVWDDNPVPVSMRLIRTIDTRPDTEEMEEETGEESSSAPRFWSWYEKQSGGDGEGSKFARKPVLWQVHTDDVTQTVQQIVDRLDLPEKLKNAVVFAAKAHDTGKRREQWQRSIGNSDIAQWLAKSDRKQRGVRNVCPDYRHEFGSVLDVLDEERECFSGLKKLDEEMHDIALHIIAAHHGRARPHFPPNEVFDPERSHQAGAALAVEVPRRFSQLQREYGRWGLAYLESLLRAADYAASANPSECVEDQQ
jgi:CRISPR-associated endonuclease/helicase Cas3